MFAESLLWKCGTGECAALHGRTAGDALWFVRLRHGLDFARAVAWLAHALGDALDTPAPPPLERGPRAASLPPLPRGEAATLWDACARVTVSSDRNF